MSTCQNDEETNLYISIFVATYERFIIIVMCLRIFLSSTMFFHKLIYIIGWRIVILCHWNTSKNIVPSFKDCVVFFLILGYFYRAIFIYALIQIYWAGRYGNIVYIQIANQHSFIVIAWHLGVKISKFFLLSNSDNEQNKVKWINKHNTRVNYIKQNNVICLPGRW